MDIIEQADLKALNTLSLPCISRLAISVYSPEDLKQACETYALDTADIRIIGSGSNLILPPVLDCVVLRYLGKSIQYQKNEAGDVIIDVDAGVVWDELVAELVAKGLRGLENLSLIPGTVGAAPVQNIGAYGVELADVFESAKVFNFATKTVETFTKEQCCFAYRDSFFKKNPNKYFILNVRLKISSTKGFTLVYGELKALKNSSELSVSKVREKVIALRRAKLPDPKELPNAGSFFKNPIINIKQANELKKLFPKLIYYPQGANDVKLAAGWLIEQAGWKGKRVGNIGMHEKQALVLVNYANAKQEEVLDFARNVQDSVAEKFKVNLEIEPISYCC